MHLIPLAEIARADAIDFITIPESERKVIRIRISRALVHAPTAAVVYQFYEGASWSPYPGSRPGTAGVLLGADA